MIHQSKKNIRNKLQHQDHNVKICKYGCVEYAPILPSDENAETQENKRRNLLQLFVLYERGPNIFKLMEETYPTLRAVLNEKKRFTENSY